MQPAGAGGVAESRPRPARKLTGRGLQWSGNPYGNRYGVEMDGNGAQLVKILWIGLDLGQTVDLKRYDRYRTFTKHDINY